MHEVFKSGNDYRLQVQEKIIAWSGATRSSITSATVRNGWNCETRLVIDCPEVSAWYPVYLSHRELDVMNTFVPPTHLFFAQEG